MKESLKDTPVYLGLAEQDMQLAVSISLHEKLGSISISNAVVVPIRSHSWLNQSYFKDRGLLESSRFLHINQKGLSYDEYAVIARYLAEEDKYYVVESDLCGTDSRFLALSYVADKLGLSVDIIEDEGAAAHSFYIDRFTSLGLQPELQAGGSLYTSKYRPENAGSRVDLVRDMTVSADISQVYADYLSAFTEVNRVDVLSSVLDEETFQTIMASESFLKYVYRGGNGEILNMAVMCDLEDTPWLNREYADRRFTPGSNHPVLTCPLVYTAPGESGAYSLSVFSEAIRSFARHGLEPTLFIECNAVSDRQIPRLVELSAKKAGVSHIKLNPPVYEQNIKIFKIKNVG